jgi:hypothetical protein
MPDKIYDDSGKEISLTISGDTSKPYSIYDDTGKPLTSDEEIARYQEGLKAEGIPQEGSLFARSWNALNKPLVSLSPQMQSAQQQFATTHPILGGIGKFATDAMTSLSSPLNLVLAATTGGAGLAEKLGAEGLASALEIPAKLTSAAMVGEGGYSAVNEPTTGGKVGGALEAIAGVMGLRHHLPSKYEMPEFIKKHGEKIENVADIASEGLPGEEQPPLADVTAAMKLPEEVAAAGGTTRDITPAAAFTGSADQVLETRELTRPIVKLVRGGFDDAQRAIGTEVRQLDEVTKGLDKKQLVAFGKAIENVATDEERAMVPDLDARVKDYRTLMDDIFAEAKVAREGDLGYIKDYYTHINKEPDDIKAGLQDIFSYHQGKNVLKAMFASPIIGEKGTGEAAGIYGKGMGQVAESPFTKERKNLLESNIDYDANKTGRMYIESMARERFLRPAVKAAEERIKSLPDSILKELSEKYVKNVTRFDSAPQLDQAYKKFARFMIDTTSRSLLGFSPRLQALHAMRLGPVYAELGEKDFARGLGHIIANPIESYKETASLGLLPNELVPFRFQTLKEKENSILNFKSYVDFIDRSIAYNGFKAKYKRAGMNDTDAMRQSIADTKRVTFMIDPSRQNIVMAEMKLHALYKQVPAKIIEWMARTYAQAKANPAAAARLTLILGASGASSLAGGPELFHYPFQMLKDTTLVQVREMGKIMSYLYRGDLDKAAEEFTLWMTPAGLSLKKTLGE